MRSQFRAEMNRARQAPAGTRSPSGTTATGLVSAPPPVIAPVAMSVGKRAGPSAKTWTEIVATKAARPAPSAPRNGIAGGTERPTERLSRMHRARSELAQSLDRLVPQPP